MLIFGSTYDTEGTGSAVAGDDAAGFDPGDTLESLCFGGGLCGLLHILFQIGGVDEVDVILFQLVGL